MLVASSRQDDAGYSAGMCMYVCCAKLCCIVQLCDVLHCLHAACGAVLCCAVGVKSDLSRTAQQLDAERDMTQQLKQQLEAIKSEYITAGV